MICRLTLRRIRLTLTIARIAKVIGVNSELESGNHVLMWDFDEVPLDEVREALRIVQTRYLLSDIYICRTKEPNNYVCYCFSSQEWKMACEIICQTRYTDWQFFRFGVYRHHWTLRVTPKNERYIKLVDVLEGYCLPDCNPTELLSWVKYETLNWR